MSKEIQLTPEVRQTYLFIEQEINNIIKAIDPLKRHVDYLRSIGQLDPLKGLPTSPEHICCDGECNHDDCCGKVEENCPNYRK